MDEGSQLGGHRVMSAPLNKAMLLGDDAVPGPAERRAHLAASIDVFLAAYGPSEP